MKQHNAWHHCHGFSLIELLMVCLITLVLATLSYPSYQSIMRHVRREQIKIKMRSLQMERLQARLFHLANPKLADFNTQAYQLQWRPHGSDGEIIAQALGQQNRDRCAKLCLWLNDSHLATPVNCWT